jgi:acyl CoA:acetate/3-ketoacid CoA transferase alpha subunit
MPINKVVDTFDKAVEADLSIIRAHKADRWGNLVYRGTARTL